MHETYDPDGNLISRTKVTRESEWDESSRGRALRLAEYQAGLCTCGCGLPVAEAHANQVFEVDAFTCYAGRAIAKKSRMDSEAADAQNRQAGWNDGLHYYAKPVKNAPEGSSVGN